MGRCAIFKYWPVSEKKKINATKSLEFDLSVKDLLTYFIDTELVLSDIRLSLV